MRSGLLFLPLAACSGTGLNSLPASRLTATLMRTGDLGAITVIVDYAVDAGCRRVVPLDVTVGDAGIPRTAAAGPTLGVFDEGRPGCALPRHDVQWLDGGLPIGDGDVTVSATDGTDTFSATFGELCSLRTLRRLSPGGPVASGDTVVVQLSPPADFSSGLTVTLFSDQIGQVGLNTTFVDAGVVSFVVPTLWPGRVTAAFPATTIAAPVLSCTGAATCVATCHVDLPSMMLDLK